MRVSVAKSLRVALGARGFDPDGRAPNDSIRLDDEFLDAHELSELLELMVVKREKAFGSVGALGQERARQLFDDAALAVAAIREVMDELLLRE